MRALFAREPQDIAHMTPRLKPLKDQVIVITGASSGIGLVTARMAAKRGARVVLTARNHEALQQAAQEITSDETSGGMAAYVAADVSDESAVRRVAEEAVARFGRIDTWVNGAGVSVYGRLMDISLEDQRRLFETNFWGVVIGSRIAVPHLRKGGALINIGSVLSDRAIPLQGIYCATKHAVKAYTDSLRMELEHDRLPIAVTLIKPYSIDTPYAEHAKNYLATEPSFPPPVYAPEVVAEAILHCAEHPTRDVYAGGRRKNHGCTQSLGSQADGQDHGNALRDAIERPVRRRSHQQQLVRSHQRAQRARGARRLCGGNESLHAGLVASLGDGGGACGNRTDVGDTAASAH